jgi:NADPH:quinone reductase-like Zn-dependent oxidoreductase
MKAIVCTEYGPPEVLQLQEVKKPAPKNNGLLIRIRATAVTASDCIVRGLSAPLRFQLAMRLVIGFTGPRQPILGMVFAGEVESVGKDVKSFTKGDAVYGWDLFPAFGAYAEYKCISEAGIVALKPTNLNYEEATAIPYGGLLALKYLKKGNIHSGQNILIYGASGAVGTAAVQLAKYFGAKVSGVCSTTNLELVKSLGADAVIDYTKEDFTARGERYGLIFNAVGKRKAILQCQQVLTPTGKHITVDDGSPKVSVDDLTYLRELVEAGKLKPVIDRSYPLEQIAEAHSYVDKGHKKGNVVITVEQSL